MGSGTSKFAYGGVHRIPKSWRLELNWAVIHGWPTCADLHLDWSRLRRAYVRRDQRRFTGPSKSYHVGCWREWFPRVRDGYYLLLHFGQRPRYFRHTDWLSLYSSLLQCYTKQYRYINHDLYSH